MKYFMRLVVFIPGNQQQRQVSEAGKCLGEKVPEGSTAGGAVCEQQGAQELALYPEGNRRP